MPMRRAFRYTQHLGDFFVAEPVDGKQSKHPARHRRQLLEGQAHLLLKLLPLPEWGIVARKLPVGLHVWLCSTLAVAAFFAQLVQHDVAQDRRHPRAKREVRVELVELEKDAGEAEVHPFHRLVPVDRVAQGDFHEVGEVFLVERILGTPVALPASHKQIKFAFSHFDALRLQKKKKRPAGRFPFLQALFEDQCIT